MSVKNKIRLGLLFLLGIIALLAISGSYYINNLAGESKDILKANYNTLQYTKQMIEALDHPDSATAIHNFELNLAKQEQNITEKGEEETTAELRKLFSAYRANTHSAATAIAIREKLLLIQQLNMDAIVNKNNGISDKTKQGFAYISILSTICFLLSFTFVINFPRWIDDPIQALTQGIRGIVNKDYTTRINIRSHDEFGQLATAFNTMAAELDKWEHSNVSQLMFEKSRMEAVINNMQDAVIGLDGKQHILFVNEVAENLLMLKRNEMTGQYAPDVALKNDLLRNLLNKEAPAELKIYANNKESYFIKNYRQVTNAEQVIGEVITLHNVTPFKELDAAKTNFIATISHELKTPIAAIKMSLQLLQNPKSGPLNAEQLHLAESISDDTNRLLKITGELLNMTQVETGNIQLTLNMVEPAQITELAIDAVKAFAEQKEIKLRLELTPNLPMVAADLDKTVWVLVNLLTNAIRYTAQGGTIRLTAERKEDKVLFAVHDTGAGIEAIHLPRVFDRYFKVPGTKGGTGLGLAISKEFIEAQGGKITATSTAGKGSTFSFLLNT